MRMDVVVQADGRTVDLEMQVSQERHMGRRLRYYQGAMDTATLESGDDFENLPECHIVFICLRDPFLLDRPAYTLDISCEEEPTLDPKVGTRWHVLNASAWKDAADTEVREVLRYVKEGVTTGTLTKEIDRLVERCNDDREWVSRVLTWEQDTRIQCRYAREEGFEQGIERGEDRFGALASRLIAEGRSEEVVFAAENREARERLFEEFDL